MENAQNTERILDKIKKCFNLSKSSNPNEAAIALRQAKALMEKYSIDAVDVMVSDVKETEVISTNRKKSNRYELWLANTVGKAFNCKILVRTYPTHSGYIQTMAFIGVKPANEIAAYVFEVTHKRLKKDRLEYIKNELDCWLTKAEKNHRANYFCEAWVNRIYQTVQDFANIKSKDNEIIDTFLEKKYGELKETEARNVNKKHISDDDYNAGYDKASDVKLYDAVSKDELTLIEN